MSRGFSLVELMVAMAVLAVGLLGGITVIAVATANDGRSKLHTNAVTTTAEHLRGQSIFPSRPWTTTRCAMSCARQPETLDMTFVGELRPGRHLLRNW